MAKKGSRVFLVIRAPNGDVREVPVGEAPVVIGRDESADVRVDDKKVSRRHAAFLLSSDGVPVVEDLGSVNGVRLNGDRIERRAEFGPDDLVIVGGYEVRLKLPEGTGSAVTGNAYARGTGVSEEIEGATDGTGDSRVSGLSASARTGPRPILVGRDPPVAGRRFQLDPGENIVGRLEDCQVPILDGSVSRQHARIVLGRDRVTLTDLNSSNGTFVNDTRIDSTDLNDGDEVRFGSIGFALEMPSGISRRVGAVQPSQMAARAHGGKADTRARTYMIAGAGVLTLAAGIFAFAIWRATRMPPPAPAIEDAGVEVAQVEAPDSGMDVVAPPVEPAAQPDAGEDVARAPAAAKDAGTKKGAEVPLVAVRKLEPTPPALTSTSPFGPKDAEGLPVNLPVVDPTFDFDGFVTAKLSEAEVNEKAGNFAALRAVLEELLEKDPINGDGRRMMKSLVESEQLTRTLKEAEAFAGKGELMRAAALYASVPKTSPAYAKAQEKVAALKGRALEEELARAETEAGSQDKKAWKKAHGRVVAVLAFDPASEKALALVKDLERKMRAKKVKFAAYVPERKDDGQVPAEPPGTPGARDAIERAFQDKALARVAELYAEGAVDQAIKQADGLSRKGDKERQKRAKAMAASLRQIKAKVQRVRTEIANDPAEAWAHLLELTRMEPEVLPAGVRSFVRKELEESVADAYAERGQGAFERNRYEEAFNHWEAGQKLAPANPKLVAGLRKLEERAVKLAQEAEIAAQRGEPDVCERWRRITKMTSSDAEVHKKARERVRRVCSAT